MRFTRLLSIPRQPLMLVMLTLFLGLVVLPEFNLALAQEEEGEGGKKNLILHIAESVGLFFGLLFLAFSVTMIAIGVLLSLDLRMSTAIPPGFVDEFTDTVNKRKFKEAFDMARSDPSFVGRVLTAGMSRLQYGIEDARDAAMNMLESIRSDKEQKNNYLAVIGTLGPLVGLVGTVFGMIMAFMELGSGSAPNPSKLAVGISHALSVTLIGVGISVPAIFLNAYIRNRIIRVSMDTGNIADDLLTQMYHNSKRPAPAGSAPGVAAAPGVNPSTTAAAPVPPAPPR